MKFATLIAVTAAVRLTQTRGPHRLAQVAQEEEKKGDGPPPQGQRGPPGAAGFIAMCDQDGDDMLDQKEVVDCLMKQMPPGAPRADVEAMIDADWPYVDTGKDGLVSVDELEAFFSSKGPGGPPPKLAQMMQKTAQGPRGPPGAAGFIKDCDQDGDTMLDQKEVVDCLMEKGPPGAPRADIEAMIAADWPNVDTSKDGLASVDELEAFFSSGPGGPPPALAQMMQKIAQGPGGPPPSPAELMAMCDASGNGKINKKELGDCMMAEAMKHAPEEMRDQVGAHIKPMIDDMFAHADVDGDGNVNMKELKAAMGGPPPALAQMMKPKRGGKSF